VMHCCGAELLLDVEVALRSGQNGWHCVVSMVDSLDRWSGCSAEIR
jgi:hypothetical protein